MKTRIAALGTAAALAVADAVEAAEMIGRVVGQLAAVIEVGAIFAIVEPARQLERAALLAERETHPDPVRAGEIELEIVPQGTLAERIRAAGAGVPAFFTATGVGTKMAVGKEHREINGRTYILETALKGDVGLIEAWEADRWGNLTFKLSGRNFNPICAMASELSIVQTQHIRELGEINPDNIHTPGIFVDRVLHVPYGDPGGF